MHQNKLTGRPLLWALTGVAVYISVLFCIQNLGTFRPSSTTMVVSEKEPSRITAVSPTNKNNNNCNDKLLGVNVLILDVHMEGNLGDEMETTPFLQHLHQCGANVTVALSNWLFGDKRLHFRTSREHHYVNTISTQQWKHFVPEEFAAVIVARKSAAVLDASCLWLCFSLFLH